MSEATNEIFRAVQDETQCPFAKSAEITFARSIDTGSSIAEASFKLFEDMTSFIQEGIKAAPDGLAVAISNDVIGKDHESLISGFKSLYRTLKLHEGYSEEEIAAENIEDSGWQLTIQGQRLFTILFSSIYPKENPRHLEGINTTFILFQPVQSFHQRIPSAIDSEEFKKLKLIIRNRFTDAGKPYDGSINDDRREAAKYIAPLHIGMKAVEWWRQ